MVDSLVRSGAGVSPATTDEPKGEMKTMSWLSRLACCLLPAAILVGTEAEAAEPFTFGMTISQTGGLAPGARAVLLGMQIWVEDTNAEGGLLGRQGKVLTYAAQS